MGGAGEREVSASTRRCSCRWAHQRMDSLHTRGGRGARRNRGPDALGRNRIRLGRGRGGTARTAAWGGASAGGGASYAQDIWRLGAWLYSRRRRGGSSGAAATAAAAAASGAAGPTSTLAPRRSRPPAQHVRALAVDRDSGSDSGASRESGSEPPLKVLTFNILAPCYFRSGGVYESSNPDAAAFRHRSIIRVLREQRADVCCLQEFWFDDALSAQVSAASASRLAPPQRAPPRIGLTPSSRPS